MSASTSSVHVVFIYLSLQRRLTLIALPVSFSSLRISQLFFSSWFSRYTLRTLLPPSSLLHIFLPVYPLASLSLPGFAIARYIFRSSSHLPSSPSSFLILFFARYPPFCLLSLDPWAFVIRSSLMTTTFDCLHLAPCTGSFFFLLLFPSSDTYLFRHTSCRPRQSSHNA